MAKTLRDSWILTVKCNEKNAKELADLPKKVDSLAKKIEKSAKAAGEEIEIQKFRLLGSMCLSCSEAFIQAVGKMPEVDHVAPNRTYGGPLAKKPKRPLPCLIGKNALGKEAKKPVRPRVCLIGKNAPGKKKK